MMSIKHYSFLIIVRLIKCIFSLSNLVIPSSFYSYDSLPSIYIFKKKKWLFNHDIHTKIIILWWRCFHCHRLADYYIQIYKITNSTFVFNTCIRYFVKFKVLLLMKVLPCTFSRHSTFCKNWLNHEKRIKKLMYHCK